MGTREQDKHVQRSRTGQGSNLQNALFKGFWALGCEDVDIGLSSGIEVTFQSLRLRASARRDAGFRSSTPLNNARRRERMTLHPKQRRWLCKLPAHDRGTLSRKWTAMVGVRTDTRICVRIEKSQVPPRLATMNPPKQMLVASTQKMEDDTTGPCSLASCDDDEDALQV